MGRKKPTADTALKQVNIRVLQKHVFDYADCQLLLNTFGPCLDRWNKDARNTKRNPMQVFDLLGLIIAEASLIRAQIQQKAMEALN